MALTPSIRTLVPLRLVPSAVTWNDLLGLLVPPELAGRRDARRQGNNAFEVARGLGQVHQLPGGELVMHVHFFGLQGRGLRGDLDALILRPDLQWGVDANHGVQAHLNVIDGITLEAFLGDRDLVGSGANRGERIAPSSLVSVSRDSLVSNCGHRTAAPGTAAPEASVTVPTMEPKSTCA